MANELKLDYTKEEFVAMMKKLVNGPLYPYYDPSDGYWKCFYSHADFLTWQGEPSAHEDLIFWSFEGKAPRTIEVAEIEYSKNILSGTTGNLLSYSFQTVESTGSQTLEAVMATYTFECGGKKQVFSMMHQPKAGGAKVSFNIDSYLADGDNTITINLRGRQTNTQRLVVITRKVVKLDIESDFSVAKPIELYADINLRVKATGVNSKEVYFLLDGQQTGVSETVSHNNFFSKQIDNELAAGKHTLQVYATMKVDDDVFSSNTLFYEFVVRGESKRYVTIANSYQPVDNVTTLVDGTPTFYAEQYVQMKIDWGFYNYDPQVPRMGVSWRIAPKDGTGEETTLSTLNGNTINATNNTPPSPLYFVPTDSNMYWMRAYVTVDGQDVKIGEYILDVKRNTSGIEEVTSDLIFKFTALGRSNTEPEADRKIWKYKPKRGNEVTVTFNGVDFNSRNGWVDNSLQLQGGATAVINTPLLKSPETDGFTLEIECEVFNISDDDTVIAQVGSMDKGGCIQLRANGATLRGSVGSSVSNNYRNNERVRMAFVVCPNVSSKTNTPRVIMITEDGVVTRSKAYGDTETFQNTTATLRLGDPDGKAGIRIYSIKAYSAALTIDQLYNSALIASSDINGMVQRNDIYVSGTSVIDADKISAVIPTLLVTGNVQQLIDSKNKVAVTMERAEWKDPKYPENNITVENLVMRRHGQSTLAFPVPSFKVWTGTSKNKNTKLFDADGNYVESGRWSVRPGWMPMKKFVFQAFYVDSSCAKSGSILKLFHDTWYNGAIGTDHPFRTEPQNYALDKYADAMKARIEKDGKKAGSYAFPETIKVSPDSLACVVLWHAKDGEDWQTLGQFVLMEDKKSDYVYGQRSIYDTYYTNGEGEVVLDPYTFDTKKTGFARLWDNKNCLQFEVLRNEHPLANLQNSDDYYGAAEDLEDEDTTLEDGTKISPAAESEAEDDRDAAEPANWSCEQAFELVYPDPSDVTADEYKGCFDTLKRMVDFVCGTYKVDNGGSGSLRAFQLNCMKYLDLYKLAAYYVFFLRFGSLDNVERNSQWRTFDGEIWHLAPWDWDIGIGTVNAGQLTYGPRINRQTPAASGNGYAFAGHNNWMWNALEAWTTEVEVNDKNGNKVKVNFMKDIVPNVAQALFNAGLQYSNVINVFNENFCDMWCERLYNESQKYKYIEAYTNRGESKDYLDYLLGRGTNHRNWWLKMQFDYYDALWFCGDYTSQYIVVRANAPRGLHFSIVSGYSTYFGWGFVNDAGSHSEIGESGVYLERGSSYTFTANSAIQENDPVNLYAASSIMEFDVHEIAPYMTGAVMLGAFMDKYTNSTNLLKLKLGVSMEGLKKGTRNNAKINWTGFENLMSLEYLDFRGFRNTQTIDLTKITTLRDFYAGCSGLTTFKPADGVELGCVELPDTMMVINMTDASWERLEFMSNSTLKTQDAPFTNLVQCIFNNMGRDANVRSLVLSWLEVMDGAGKLESDCMLQVSDMYWGGSDMSVTWEEMERLTRLRASRGEAYCLLQGYIRVSKRFTSEEMAYLMSVWGDGIFNGESTLIIDCESSDYIVSVSGDDVVSENGKLYITEGGSARISAIAFPVAVGKHEMFYGVKNRQPSEDGFTYYNSIMVDSNTGMVTTKESGRPEYMVTLNAEENTASGELRSGEATIYVRPLTYPSSVHIVRQIGSNVIEPNVNGVIDVTNLDGTNTVTLKPVYNKNYTGTLLRDIDWIVTNENHLYELDALVKNNNYLQININTDYPQKEQRESVRLTAVFKNNYNGEHPLVSDIVLNFFNVIAGIISKNSNNPLFLRCMELIGMADDTTKQNISSQDIKLLTGAFDATGHADIGWLGSVGTRQLTYNLFEYATNVASVDLSKCTDFYGDVIMDGCDACTFINLANTHIRSMKDGDLVTGTGLISLLNMEKLSSFTAGNFKDVKGIVVSACPKFPAFNLVSSALKQQTSNLLYANIDQSSTENADYVVIDQLYRLDASKSNLVGTIASKYIDVEKTSVLNSRYKDLKIVGQSGSGKPQDIIEFKDAVVKTKMEGLYKNADGVVTVQRVGEETNYANISFLGNSEIVRFDELKYFTGLARLQGFQNCLSLQSVRIPAIAEIGTNAFNGCLSLTSVGTIPESVKKISMQAFYGCRDLGKVNLPSACTLETSAFRGCSNLEIDSIPNGVTFAAGNQLFFEGCSKLNLAKLPDTWTYVPIGCFTNCSSLTLKTLPTRITEIMNQAFQNTSVEFSELPDAVKRIGNYAFSRTNVSFSSLRNVEEIGNDTFFDCKNFTAVLDLSKIKSLGANAFYDSGVDCGRWSKNLTTVNKSTFYGCKNLKSLRCDEYFDIVTSIEDNAFNSCSNLVLGSLPSRIVSIGVSAFRFCTSLEIDTLPSTLTSIGNSAFHGCSNVGFTSIPVGVTIISDGVFQSCSNIKISSIGNNVEYIGDHAFSACTNMSDVILDLSGCTKLKAISGEAFSDITGKFGVSKFPPNIETIGNYAFRNCYKTDGSVTHLKMPSTLKTIGNGCFQNCDKLQVVDFSDCPVVFADAIPNSLFNNCRELVSFGDNMLKDGLKVVSGSAFTYCSKLRFGNLPDSVEELGSYSLHGCNSLNMTKLPDNLKKIGNAALDALTGCSITSLPENLPNDCFAEHESQQNAHVFASCGEGMNISSVPSLWTYIPVGFFRETNGRGGITLHAGITDVRDYSFYSCQKDTITLSPSLKTIGVNSFARCTNITSIDIPATVTSIGLYAFEGCTKLTTIIVRATTPPTLAQNANLTFGSKTIRVPSSAVSAYKANARWNTCTIVSL